MEQGSNAVARRAAPTTPVVDDRRRAPDRRLVRRGAAHDARLALATVRALLATQLEREPRLPADVVACLHAVAGEVDRVTVLLGPDVGRPGDEVCDLAAVARDVAHVLEAASGVAVCCRGRAVFAAADATTVWRVLTNLVHNACRAATDTGAVTVTVSVADRPGAVVVRVHDTGAAAVSPWNRGIGLDVVGRLVADLGGALDVVAAPDGGTEVRVMLAAATPTWAPIGCVTA